VRGDEERKGIKERKEVIVSTVCDGACVNSNVREEKRSAIKKIRPYDYDGNKNITT
jgi:hypothetical protein